MDKTELQKKAEKVYEKYRENPKGKLTKEEQAVIFGRFVEVKRQNSELLAESKVQRGLWERVAEDSKLPDGLGEIEIFAEQKMGIKISMKKGSISKTKLKEEGVAEDIIDRCTGSSKSVEIYTGKP